MVRSIEGQGLAQDEEAALVRGARPCRRRGRRRPSTPKKGRPVEPGLAGTAPGKVVIMIEPVSVCHQVSTIGQRPPPICVIPDPGLGVDRLADGAEEAQAADRSLFAGPLVPPSA
jgi:hypothetical protein